MEDWLAFGELVNIHNLQRCNWRFEPVTDNLQKRWIPHESVLENLLGDETVILHLESSTYFGLDDFGTKVWSMLKDGKRPAEICDILSGQYGVEQARVAADISTFLDDLIAKDLIVEG